MNATVTDAIGAIVDLAIEALAAVIGHVVVLACGLVLLVMNRGAQ